MERPKAEPSHRPSHMAEAAPWEIAIRVETAHALSRKECPRGWALTEHRGFARLNITAKAGGGKRRQNQRPIPWHFDHAKKIGEAIFRAYGGPGPAAAAATPAASCAWPTRRTEVQNGPGLLDRAADSRHAAELLHEAQKRPCWSTRAPVLFRQNRTVPRPQARRMRCWISCSHREEAGHAPCCRADPRYPHVLAAQPIRGQYWLSWSRG